MQYLGSICLIILKDAVRKHVYDWMLGLAVQDWLGDL